jgi:secreted trypsin-like serine protease
MPIDISLDEIDAGRNVYMAGFGSDDETQAGNREDQLKEVTAPVRDGETCQNVYQKENLLFDPQTSLCTGSFEEKEGHCIGDLGGPVIDVFPNGDGTVSKKLVGMQSFGIGCGNKKFGSVSVKMNQEKLDWILETAKELHCNVFKNDLLCKVRPRAAFFVKILT